MQLAFIGAGSMASAIVHGITQAGALKARDIIISSASGQSAKQLAQTVGANAYPSNLELVNQLQPHSQVILCVKPAQILSVLEEIAPALHQGNHLLVSIAAGTTLRALSAVCHPEQAIVRIMPNVNVRVREGMCALCATANTPRPLIDYLSGLFQAVGDVVELPEKFFPAFAALAGCSPAWTAKYIDALATAALAHGIPKATAVRIASQAVLGTAKSLISGEADNLTPAALADSVQSPAGTTVAGSIAIERHGFNNATMAAIDAAIARDFELSNKTSR